MSTKLSTKLDIKSLLSGQQFREQVALALPRHLTPDRFIRVALTALTRTPKLAECDQASFFKCLLDLSSLGIEPDGRRAHLIPFRNSRRNCTECQLIIDYKGLIELARRSGDVKSWRAETVRENDVFEWRNGEVQHVVDWRKPRGEVQAVYSAVTLADGILDHEVMTLDEVEAVRKRSRSANDGPWVTDWAEMAKKTVMRRHSKRLTLSPEFHDALIAEEGNEPKEVQGRVVERAHIPFLPASTPEPEIESIPADEDTDHIPFDEPAAETPAPESEPPAPAAKKRVARAEAPPLTLEATPERAVEQLRRRVAEAKLDPVKVDQWLDKNGGPPLAEIHDHEAEMALGLWLQLREEAK